MAGPVSCTLGEPCIVAPGFYGGGLKCAGVPQILQILFPKLDIL